MHYILNSSLPNTFASKNQPKTQDGKGKQTNNSITPAEARSFYNLCLVQFKGDKNMTLQDNKFIAIAKDCAKSQTIVTIGYESRYN